ncbi:MAG: M50 family metallopeptidase [Actinobacteria bacterium]|nr:M50 family metallopeptidase [Actinomycetota bacterium]
MQIIGILSFVVALLLSVMLHEFGHYVMAKRFGMKVSEFFLGFGQRLWSTRRGETEFGIKLIPAGGYCKIEGMTPTDVMPAGEEDRAFYSATSGRKLIVLGAGSFLHFVLGYLLLFVLFAGIGTNQLLPVVSEVVKGSVAQSVGIEVGDEITSINGVKVTDWYVDVLKIRNSHGKELTLGIKRDSQDLILVATPKLENVDGTDRFILGIISDIGLKRTGVVTSFKNAGLLTRDFLSQSVTSLTKLPGKIPALWGQTVNSDKRDANGLVGVVGVARVSGETLSNSQRSPMERFATFILIIASLNIFVGLFNLLPILPLDGGHMAVAIADEIRAFIARLRGRARPAAIDVTTLTPITMVVFAILAALTLLLLVADIVNPVILNL